MGQDPSKGGDSYRKIENVYHKRNRRKKKYVTSVFRWSDGGKTVSIIGSFNNWREEIPMQFNPDDGAFVVILTLAEGKHLFRYIVDDEFRTDSNFPVQRDSDGYYSNIVELRDEASSPPTAVPPNGASNSSPRETRPAATPSIPIDRPPGTSPPADSSSTPTSTSSTAKTPSRTTTPPVRRRRGSSRSNRPSSTSETVERLRNLPHKPPRDMTFPSGFGRNRFAFPETRKTPPLLPPHLRFTPLRSQAVSVGSQQLTPEELCFDSSIMPMPLHVTLNRCYFSSCRRVNYRRDPVWVLGLTQGSGPSDDRKFTTVKFYYDPSKLTKVPGVRKSEGMGLVHGQDEVEVEDEGEQEIGVGVVPTSPSSPFHPLVIQTSSSSSSSSPSTVPVATSVKRGGIYQAFQREAESPE